MKRILIILAALATFLTAAEATTTAATPKTTSATIPASDARITYIGRTATGSAGMEGITPAADASSVSYDWSGVTAVVRFVGTDLTMDCSDTHGDWFNVWIDKAPTATEDTRFKVSGDASIVLASGLPKGEHIVYLQKRTEGEQGLMTIRSFTATTSGKASKQAPEFLQAPGPKARRIEFIGDSYTCGFGTEGASRDDPFLAETENCNLAYAAILGRFFDASISTVSHSGRGIVRNWGDAAEGDTMVGKYDQTFDSYADGPVWDASRFLPDIVVIYLGTNDFSVGKQPSLGSWCLSYAALLNKIRRNYGETVPILCVGSDADELMALYIEQAVRRSGVSNTHWAMILPDAHNLDTDLGSCWHPNYAGQRKVACSMAPFVSTLTGWDLPAAPLE